MKSETMAIHGGYETDPTTKPSRCRSIRPSPTSSTAPITAPRCSISKSKAIATAASAIRPPPCSNAASPRSKAASRRCASAPGQAALNYAMLNLADMGSNIVSVPQLYGTTHTLFAHVLPSQGISVRFAESDQRRRDREADRRQDPRRCSARASAIRPATSATSKRWPRSPSGTAFRWSSTTPWRRRSCCARSSTAPTSSCIR